MKTKVEIIGGNVARVHSAEQGIIEYPINLTYRAAILDHIGEDEALADQIHKICNEAGNQPAGAHSKQSAAADPKEAAAATTAKRPAKKKAAKKRGR